MHNARELDIEDYGTDVGSRRSGRCLLLFMCSTIGEPSGPVARARLVLLSRSRGHLIACTALRRDFVMRARAQSRWNLTKPPKQFFSGGNRYIGLFNIHSGGAVENLPDTRAIDSSILGAMHLSLPTVLGP